MGARKWTWRCRVGGGGVGQDKRTATTGAEKVKRASAERLIYHKVIFFRRRNASHERRLPEDSQHIQMSPSTVWCCATPRSHNDTLCVLCENRSEEWSHVPFTKPNPVGCYRCCVMQDAPNPSPSSSSSSSSSPSILGCYSSCMCVTVSCPVLFSYSPVSLA